MRSLALIPIAALAALSAPAAAEKAQSPGPAPVQAWDPTAYYISIGQDEPGYRNWYIAAPWHAAAVGRFNDYLVRGGVGGIVPTWQLLRTATSWQDCGAQPFEVPPTSEWPNVVQTLRYIRDHVIPVIGPVEPVSGYRNPGLNVCAGGAPESAHKHYSAIDMVPLRPIDRNALIKSLCDAHTARGAPYSAGLGFYAYLRFHVDSTKFRRWNMDPKVLALCPPIVQAERDLSVAQSASPASPADLPQPAGTTH